jgi:hypothetical protein
MEAHAGALMLLSFFIWSQYFDFTASCRDVQSPYRSRGIKQTTGRRNSNRDRMPHTRADRNAARMQP